MSTYFQASLLICLSSWSSFSSAREIDAQSSTKHSRRKGSLGTAALSATSHGEVRARLGPISEVEGLSPPFASDTFMLRCSC